MYYFDCLCEVGPRNGKDHAAPWTTADVLESMDRCGIAGALVTHTLSMQDNPLYARRLLSREIARAPRRLFPVWTVVPGDAGDGDSSPVALLRDMNRHGVRTVKLFPKSHNWPPVSSIIGPWLEALERARVLTMINFFELPDSKPGESFSGAYRTLDWMLGEFPNLPVLVQDIWWSAQRVIIPLMEKHGSLHIEFSSYQVNCGIEEYVRRFGPERLLFGTGLPAKSAGAARAFLDYSAISGKDKALVAGGNLSRLLGGIFPEYPGFRFDPICRRAAEGKPVGGAVMDAHCHVLPRGCSGTGANVMYAGDADGIRTLKRRLGVRSTAIMSWMGPVASEPLEGNRIVADAVARYPKDFVGVASVNPTHLSARAMMAELRRRVERDGFVGLKPYHLLGLKYSHPLYEPCWEYANNRGLYVLLHLGGAGGGMDVLNQLAEKYPEAQWVVAHSGASFDMGRHVAEAMLRSPNIWAELTLTSVTNGLIEWLVSKVGDERILFGTDSPMRDPRPQFGWVVWADISEKSRRRILGENFLKLLSMRKPCRGAIGRKKGTSR